MSYQTIRLNVSPKDVRKTWERKRDHGVFSFPRTMISILESKREEMEQNSDSEFLHVLSFIYATPLWPSNRALDKEF